MEHALSNGTFENMLYAPANFIPTAGQTRLTAGLLASYGGLWEIISEEEYETDTILGPLASLN